jgi:hypothetical protein
MSWFVRIINALGMDRLAEAWFGDLPVKSLLRVVDVLAVVWSLLCGSLAALAAYVFLASRHVGAEAGIASGVGILVAAMAFFWLYRFQNLRTLHRLARKDDEP